jgi:hypothetical protein
VVRAGIILRRRDQQRGGDRRGDKECFGGACSLRRPEQNPNIANDAALAGRRDGLLATIRMPVRHFAARSERQPAAPAKKQTEAMFALATPNRHPMRELR